jgi:hypothetical protein
MAKKISGAKTSSEVGSSRCDDRTAQRAVPTKNSLARRTGEGRGEGDGGRLQRPSALLDTRVVYYGDNLEQLAKLPDACVDLIYIDPPAWPKPLRRGEGPRCVRLARVLKKTGSFYYHCDWHASHYVKVMLDQIFGEN